jgi:hypothetical protein
LSRVPQGSSKEGDSVHNGLDVNDKNTLYLKITTDEKFHFFSLYTPLTKLEKNIFKLCVWYVKKFPNACPRQETIAKKLGCSRKHVNRTFSKFKKFGWITLSSRGKKRSKTMGVTAHIQQMDLVKQEWFRRVEVTSKVTHSYSNNKNITSGDGEKFKPKILASHARGKKFGFSKSGCIKLSLFSDSTIEEARRIMFNHGKSGWMPDGTCESYYFGIAVKIARRKGEYLDWASFYYTIEKLGVV